MRNPLPRYYCVPFQSGEAGRILSVTLNCRNSHRVPGSQQWFMQTENAPMFLSRSATLKASALSLA